MRVRDVMTYGAIGVPETASLAETGETMLRSHVSAVFVFDEKGRLAGVLSEGDLLRRAELETEKKRPQWLEYLLSGGRLAEAYVRAHGRKIGEIMTRKVFTIAEDADLSVAVDLMMKHHVKRLPVLRGDTVLGVVSRSDVLKGLLAALPNREGARPDAEIKAAIAAELDKLGWAPTASVSVAVLNGVVTFNGAISDERLRDGLKVVAENIPGVVAVRDRMAWIEPNSGLYIPVEDEDQAKS